MGENTILLKVHEAYRWVVALCDVDLKGRTLQEGSRVLDLSGPFFAGEEMNEEKALVEIERCVNEDATFNIVGKHAIAIAKKAGLIGEEGIMEIESVPFALVLV